MTGEYRPAHEQGTSAVHTYTVTGYGHEYSVGTWLGRWVGGWQDADGSYDEELGMRGGPGRCCWLPPWRSTPPACVSIHPTIFPFDEAFVSKASQIILRPIPSPLFLVEREEKTARWKRGRLARVSCAGWMGHARDPLEGGGCSSRQPAGGPETPRPFARPVLLSALERLRRL